MRVRKRGWVGVFAVLSPSAFALGVLVLLGSVRPCQAQIEPEVYTASRGLNEALSSNPPDVATAVDILVGFDRPLYRQVLQSKWVHFLADRAPGNVEGKRKKLAVLFDAFDDSLAAGESVKQRAKTFIKLRDELLARSIPETEIERSAAVFVERLRKLPDAHRKLLKEFSGRQAKDAIKGLTLDSRLLTPGSDASPWGIASGAEWSGDYPKFNPMLQKAGVRWLRLFPEWQSIQPKKDEWNWKGSDALVADARANNIQLVGVWCYLARWASADGGSRKFPIKDIQYWRDYTSGTAARYKNDIKYWEVWNEFNGSFGDSKNKVKDYAELVVTAYDAAKKVDPSVKIGLSVANFDVGFLDAVIKAGAADHFDFICVHPYENLGAVAEGGEVGYLSLADNLRKMLAANKQRQDIPLWITEIGVQAPIKPDAKGDAEQADMLAKAYVLSMVQGFEKIFWFEARGPAYGKGTDHGIIRPDWTPRPAYDALKTMTTLLGPEPRYLGWLDLGKGGYGFLFKGQKGNVLAAWSPASKQYCQVKFDAEVAVTDLAGKQSSLSVGQVLVLAQRPVFISDLPADLVKQAQGNVSKPYP
jgi:hypothetical protein